MEHLLYLIGLLLLINAVFVALVYFFIKATSYYKNKSGVSMGPSIVTVCLSFDLLFIITLIGEKGTWNTIAIVFVITAIALFVYALIRDVRSYRNYAIGHLEFKY